MQNKPNLLDAQMNVGFYLTKTYENNLCSGLLENKPNSKPIKPNTKPIQSQSKPIQSQNKPNQTQSCPPTCPAASPELARPHKQI